MDAGVSLGAYTRTGTPAAAPYAASAAPALPAVGTTMPATPSAFARVTAALIPRALNEPVGLSPSSLIQSRADAERVGQSLRRKERRRPLAERDR